LGPSGSFWRATVTLTVNGTTAFRLECLRRHAETFGTFNRDGADRHGGILKPSTILPSATTSTMRSIGEPHECLA